MSFGWSAADIVSAVSTPVKVGKALKESGGAASEYQDTIDFLTSLGKTLTGLQNVLEQNPDLKWEPELIEQAESLKSAVEGFKKKIDKYDLSLRFDTERKKARRIPREVQFALSSQVKELRASISQPQIVLGVFIGLQNLSSILDLSRAVTLSHEELSQLTENIARELPYICHSVNTLREGMVSSIQEAKDLQQESERKIRDTLTQVLSHTREVETIQKSLADKQEANKQELANWQMELRSTIQAFYDCSKSQLELLLQNEARLAQPKSDSPTNTPLQIALGTIQIISAVVSGISAISLLASQPGARPTNFPPSPLPYRVASSPVAPGPSPYTSIWEAAYNAGTDSSSQSNTKLPLRTSHILMSKKSSNHTPECQSILSPVSAGRRPSLPNARTYLPLEPDVEVEGQNRRSAWIHSEMSYSLRRFLDDHNFRRDYQEIQLICDACHPADENIKSWLQDFDSQFQNFQGSDNGSKKLQ